MMKKTAGNRKRIFISSVRKELQPERRAIKDFVENDPLLRRFFDVFLFENLPACEGRADEVYLEEVGRCDVYVGILANEYGSRQHSVLAPAEYELPKDAVTEAIVNAVAHRDYTSNARTSSRCACFISFTQPSRFARHCLVNWDSLYGNQFARRCLENCRQCLRKTSMDSLLAALKFYSEFYSQLLRIPFK